MRRVTTCLAILATVQIAAAKEAEKPAESMRDVREHFARCLHMPVGAENSAVTLHFSLNRDGGLIGEPRVAWLKLDAGKRERTRVEPLIAEAFKQCVPVPLGKDLARLTPGKVYFLRVEAAKDAKSGPRFLLNGPID